jgi:hypothetical protein
MFYNMHARKSFVVEAPDQLNKRKKIMPDIALHTGPPDQARGTCLVSAETPGGVYAVTGPGGTVVVRATACPAVAQGDWVLDPETAARVLASPSTAAAVVPPSVLLLDDDESSDSRESSNSIVNVTLEVEVDLAAAPLAVLEIANSDLEIIFTELGDVAS